METVGGSGSPIGTWSSDSPPARPRRVFARLLVVLGVLSASLAIQRGCRLSASRRIDAGAAGHGPLRLELRVPDSVGSGKEVPIWLIAINTGSDSVRLKPDPGWSPVAGEFDIQVDDASGSAVWRRIRPDQDGVKPIEVGNAVSRVIPPHGQVAWSAGWNQRNNHGALVAPGEYFVVGLVPAGGVGPAVDSLRSPRRKLVIVQ